MKFRNFLTALVIAFSPFLVIAQKSQTNTRINKSIAFPRADIANDIKLNFIDSSIFKATWYIKLNLAELRKTNLFSVIKGKHIKFSDSNFLNLEDDIPDTIEKFYMYGNHLKYSGNVSFLIKGSFSDAEIIKLIQDKFYSVNGVNQLKQLKNISTRGYSIYAFELKNTKNSHKKWYAKHLGRRTFIFTNDINEVRIKVKAWKNYEKQVKKFSTFVDLNTDILVFNVNTEVAKENIGLNLAENNYVMQSKLFKITRNIVARFKILDKQIVIGAALATKNDETAQQVEKILSGIIAYNSLESSNLNSLTQALLKNLLIARKGENVHLSSYLPIDSIVNSMQAKD